jgi:molybdate transport system substrate-binding protein
MKRTLIRSFIVIGLGLVAGAEEIRIAAAASLAEAITEISTAYQKETGTKATPVFAGSNVLARQIEEGAPLDIFLSADEATMDKLAKANLVKEPKGLLTNALVVVVPADSEAKITGAADLSNLKRIAIGDPAAVPAGVYAKAWLSKLGLWENLEGKFVGTENVRAALAAVEAGNADAAIVYRTDATISKKVRIAWSVPEGEAPPILYPVAVCAESKHAEEAQRFATFLSGNKSSEIFKARGFGLKSE